MTINPSKFRKNNSAGIGTVDGLILAAVACFAINWAYNSVKETYFAKPSGNEAIALAQEVISMAEAAHLAGIDLVDESSVYKTVARIATGTQAQKGSFRGQYFGMPQLDLEKQKIVARHLTFEQGKLAISRGESIYY